jgi:predicted lipoprotein with Yx(FWY)xxD motif
MSKSSIVWIVIVIIVVIGGVWWWMSMSGSPSYAPVSPPVATTSQPAAAGNPAPVPSIVLNAATSPTLGGYLTASNGMTLYVFAKDTLNVSNCTGQCAAFWPPYEVSSTVGLAGGTGVAGSIGTITRADDGGMQVTYNGIPLYFYQKDVKVGDTTGQGVMGLWVVAKP